LLIKLKLIPERNYHKQIYLQRKKVGFYEERKKILKEKFENNPPLKKIPKTNKTEKPKKIYNHLLEYRRNYHF